MRKDLTGVHFKTTTATEPPYVTTEKANLSNIEKWPKGYIVSHISDIRKGYSSALAVATWDSRHL